jgi:hypothetical protein
MAFRVLAAFDKFKDSLPAKDVVQSCLDALHKHYPGMNQILELLISLLFGD